VGDISFFFYFDVMTNKDALQIVVEELRKDWDYYSTNALPYIIKTVIGYCHFYYQLGYGLVFYIYIYRRYRANKKSN